MAGAIELRAQLNSVAEKALKGTELDNPFYQVIEAREVRKVIGDRDRVLLDQLQALRRAVDILRAESRPNLERSVAVGEVGPALDPATRVVQFKLASPVADHDEFVAILTAGFPDLTDQISAGDGRTFQFLLPRLIPKDEIIDRLNAAANRVVNVIKYVEFYP